jgi:hypothetical protein
MQFRDLGCQKFSYHWDFNLVKGFRFAKSGAGVNSAHVAKQLVDFL